jgi:hypothetical protein
MARQSVEMLLQTTNRTVSLDDVSIGGRRADVSFVFYICPQISRCSSLDHPSEARLPELVVYH